MVTESVNLSPTEVEVILLTELPGSRLAQVVTEVVTQVGGISFKTRLMLANEV